MAVPELERLVGSNPLQERLWGLLALALYRSDRDEPRRQCPGCGKIVMAYDALCTRCGTELEYPDELIAPEAQLRGLRSAR